ncbi:hypothetical protein D3C81_1813760 [compost metagenome]
MSFSHRIDSGKNLIMATHMIIDRCYVDSHQFCHPLRCKGSQRHHRFTAHGMPNQRGFFNAVGIQGIQKILGHRRVSHFRGARGKAVITHIDLQNIVVGNQIPGEDPEVIQATKKTVNQDDGRISVQVLCSLRSAV